MTEYFGIYGCANENNDPMYIGSSRLDLQQIEWNHRNWKKNGWYETKFRKALATEGKNWKFFWIEERRRISRRQCEIEEGALIRWIKPTWNIDKYPFEHSVKEGRMDAV